MIRRFLFPVCAFCLFVLATSLSPAVVVAETSKCNEKVCFGLPDGSGQSCGEQVNGPPGVHTNCTDNPTTHTCSWDTCTP